MEHGSVEHGSAWRTWCLKRLDAAGYDSSEGAAVKYAVNELARTLQELHMSPDDAARALTLLAGFAEGRDVPDELRIGQQDSGDGQQWVSLAVGQIQRGMRVRVVPDAYTGRMHVHNGMTGKIVGVRNGVAAVQYDGAPVGAVVHHVRNVLECAV